MDTAHDDRFLVYLRVHRPRKDRPDAGEKLVVSCSTYEEARRVQREFRCSSRECVIRYGGEEAGAGD